MAGRKNPVCLGGLCCSQAAGDNKVLYLGRRLCTSSSFVLVGCFGRFTLLLPPRFLVCLRVA